MNNTDTYVKRIQKLSQEDGSHLSEDEANDLLLRLSELIKYLSVNEQSS